MEQARRYYVSRRCKRTPIKWLRVDNQVWLLNPAIVRTFSYCLLSGHSTLKSLKLSSAFFALCQIRTVILSNLPHDSVHQRTEFTLHRCITILQSHIHNLVYFIWSIFEDNLKVVVKTYFPLLRCCSDSNEMDLFQSLIRRIQRLPGNIQ